MRKLPSGRLGAQLTHGSAERNLVRSVVIEPPSSSRVRAQRLAPGRTGLVGRRVSGTHRQQDHGPSSTHNESEHHDAGVAQALLPGLGKAYQAKVQRRTILVRSPHARSFWVHQPSRSSSPPCSGASVRHTRQVCALSKCQKYPPLTRTRGNLAERSRRSLIPPSPRLPASLGLSSIPFEGQKANSRWYVQHSPHCLPSPDAEGRHG